MQVAFRLVGESLISRENFDQVEAVAHRLSVRRSAPYCAIIHKTCGRISCCRRHISFADGRSEEINHYEEDKAAAKEAFELARKGLGTSDPETIDCASPRHQSCTEIGRYIPGLLTRAALWARFG